MRQFSGGGYPQNTGYQNAPVGGPPVADPWSNLNTFMSQCGIQQQTVNIARDQVREVQTRSGLPGPPHFKPWLLNPGLHYLKFSDGACLYRPAYFQKKIYHSSLKLPLTLSYDHKHSTIILLGGPQGPRLELKGTVSYTLAGNSYNAPVRLVLPHNFPMASPYVFLDPAAGMVVNPSYLNRPPPRLPRVDPNYQNLLYSDYTSSWRPGDCSLLMLLAALVSTFSTETPMQAQSRPPPVVSPGMDVVQPPPQGESHCVLVCVCVRALFLLFACVSFLPHPRARSSHFTFPVFLRAFICARARGQRFSADPKVPLLAHLTEAFRKTLSTRFAELVGNQMEAQQKGEEMRATREQFNRRVEELSAYSAELHRMTAEEKAKCGELESALLSAKASMSASSSSSPSSTTAVNPCGDLLETTSGASLLECEVEADSLLDYAKLLRELHTAGKLETGHFLKDVRVTHKSFWMAKSKAAKERERLEGLGRIP